MLPQSEKKGSHKGTGSWQDDTPCLKNVYAYVRTHAQTMKAKLRRRHASYGGDSLISAVYGIPTRSIERFLVRSYLLAGGLPLSNSLCPFSFHCVHSVLVGHADGQLPTHRMATTFCTMA